MRIHETSLARKAACLALFTVVLEACLEPPATQLRAFDRSEPALEAGRPDVPLLLDAQRKDGMDAQLEAPATGAVQRIEVFNARNEPVPLNAIPRRPRIRLIAANAAEIAARGFSVEGTRGRLMVATRVTEREIEIVPRDLLASAEEIVITQTPARGARDASSSAFDPIVLRTASTPNAGAKLVATWPPDGARNVPRTARDVFLVFDGNVENLSALGVRDANGNVQTEITNVDCAENALGVGVCLRLRVVAPVMLPGPRTVRHDGLLDGSGAAVDPFEIRLDLTASSLPLTFSTVSCRPGELPFEAGCALFDDEWLRIRAFPTSPSRARVTVGSRTASAITQNSEVELSIVGDLAPDAAAIDFFALNDRLVAFEVLRDRAEPFLRVAIAGVQSNPVGPDPDQEWVAIENYGGQNVSGSDLILADEAGEDVLDASFLLAPGARALVVGARFDASAFPRLPAGMPLIRLSSPIGSAGLANRGERVSLLDSTRRRLSGAPGLALAEGACAVRSALHRTDRVEDFEILPDEASCMRWLAR